jgi:hypothetical protein
MSFKRRVWIAALGGLLLSIALFLLFHLTFSSLVYWPQAIGLYVCLLLRGVHSASEADFILISIPINAVVYALFILALSGLISRQKNPKQGPSGLT